MNAQKFTQKSLEAIQKAQDLAVENQNSQIEEEHLILALLEQEDSLIKELLNKIGISDSFEREIKNKVENDPKMIGVARKSDSIYVSQDIDRVLTNSEKIADKMKDEYVSVEHIMLAIFDNPSNEIKEIFKKNNLNKNDFLKKVKPVFVGFFKKFEFSS